MKNYILLLTSFLTASCNMTQNANTANDTINMLVGTYTDADSEGIYSLQFHQNTGEHTFIDTLKIANPSFLCVNEHGNRIYAVSEMNDSTAAVSSINYDAHRGTMVLQNTALTHGADPCYVSSNGTMLLTANYTGGSMSVLPLNDNGFIEEMNMQIPGEANNATERQAEPHVHCAMFSPDGKYIFATDFGSDRILRFPALSPTADNQTAYAVRQGSGPRHITFSPDGRHLYSIGELAGNITHFEYNHGDLKLVDDIVCDSVAAGSADIHLSHDGRFLYASVRLVNDGIAIYSVDPTDGRLTRIGYQLTGIHPRNFAITPNDKYLLVACRDSNVIQVYERNTETGLLTLTENDIKISHPVCIQFFEN